MSSCDQKKVDHLGRAPNTERRRSLHVCELGDNTLSSAPRFVTERTGLTKPLTLVASV